jgi:hypothetical protein
MKLKNIILILLLFAKGYDSTAQSILIPAYRDNIAKQVKLEKVSDAKKTITLIITGDVMLKPAENGLLPNPLPEPERMSIYAKYWKARIEKAFSDSDLFSEVKIIKGSDVLENTSTDYLASVHIISNIASFDMINSCLFWIPQKLKDDIIIKLKIKDKNGAIKTYQAEETYTVLAHSLGLLTRPFYDSEKAVRNAIYYDLTSQLLVKAYNEGAFEL